MTLERPPLPPNTISLYSPWLPKNGMQGHFSIYCRLFPPGASSNSLRNLLEVSCNIFHSIIYLRNLLEYFAPVTLTYPMLHFCRKFSSGVTVGDGDTRGNGIGGGGVFGTGIGRGLATSCVSCCM